MDDARRWTDEQLRQMEQRITDMYSQAQSELQQKWNDYMTEVAAELQPLQDAYDAAKKAKNTDEMKRLKRKLQQAKRDNTLQNRWYRAMLDEVTTQLANVNQTAVAYLNGEMPRIYTENYNAITAEARKYGISFTLTNEYTVRNLMIDGEIELPQKKVDIPKDKRWNSRALNDAVLQGILQGESMNRIADRIVPVVHNNRTSAIRNARTMVTGAENRGRYDSYRVMEDDGMVMTKQWMATPDDRTRPSHMDIDGEEQNINDYFSNGLMFPGDPNGSPEEVWNCFVGDTNIAVDSAIVRSYKHEYRGNVISVKTAAGVQFSCTPNHPILTPRGWVPVKSLNCGDDILITRGRHSEVTRRNPYIDHAFPRMDTIHELFYKLGSKRTCNLGVNFHGDIPTSDVEIVSRKRLLRKDSNSRIRKFFDELFFKDTDTFATSGSHLVESFVGIDIAFFRNVRRFGKFFSILSRRLRHSKIHRFRTAARCDADGVQPTDDDGTRNTELRSESLDRLPGIVFIDKVVDIQVANKSCHVYNLQTENGYYFVNSIIPQKKENGNDFFAIAHNCRCTMTTNIYGFRRADGSVSRVNRSARGETMHERQMREERNRRTEERRRAENG